MTKRRDETGEGGLRGAAAVAGVALVAVLALGTTAGCRPAARPEPPPKAVDPLAVAVAAYDAADYPAAVRAFEAYLAADPDGAAADRALYQLGLLYALPTTGVADPAAAKSRLHSLVERFPASSHAAEARALLALMDEVDRLRGELKAQRRLAEELKRDLEALKRIDLGEPKSP